MSSKLLSGATSAIPTLTGHGVTIRPLSYHLNSLMGTGREYTANELYKYTGEKWKAKPMYLESFRRELIQNPLYGCYYNEKRRVWLWRCTHVLVPAPCQIRKEIRAWFTRLPFIG